jgi:uncharacterized protein YbjT (DUF2867 family)
MVLITGATGNNGKEIIKALAGRGVAVRAMVRKAAGQGEFPRGVEQTIANFDDAQSLEQALTGVERAFLVTPSSEKVQDQQLRFVAAARKAGVRSVVYLSQLNAKKESPVRFLRYHAVVEEALEESGLAVTVLRPNLYMQGLLLFKQMISSEGVIAAPVGDARISIVDVRDIAAVGVAALTEAGHEGKTYDITGPQALTHSELAAQLSETLEKNIRFQDISEVSMLQALLSFQMPRWQAEGLVEDYAHYARGEADMVTTQVKEVTGHSPRDFRLFTRDYKAAFE